MILPGSLRTTTLGDVLGKLHRGGVSGVLELIAAGPPWAGTHHLVTLVSGIVRDVATPLPAPRIGEVLRDQGVLRDHEHLRFVEALDRTRARSGALLVELGLVSEATLRYGLSRQMRLRLDRIFGIDSGELRFHPLARARAVSSVALGPRDFLHGRPRARDRGRDRDSHGSHDLEHAAGRRAALDLLGLGHGATRDQIRHAFRKTAAQVHPDLHRNLDARGLAAMQARFAELSRAYHLLITMPSETADEAAA